jgi:hypothetical protein
VTFANRAVDGGRDKMRINDRTIRITDQPGLNANRRQWRDGPPEMSLPHETPTGGAQPIVSPPTDGNGTGPVRLSP